MRRLNARLPLLAAAVYSSMLTAYAFIMLSAAPALVPKWMALILFISNAIQLVSLPLLGVAGRVQSEDTARIIRETHDEMRDLVTALHAKHDAFAASLTDDGR